MKPAAIHPMKYKNLESIIRRCDTETAWIEKLKKLDIMDDQDTSGNTPLGISAYYGSVEACEFILKQGGSIDFKGSGQVSALHMAIGSWGSNGTKSPTYVKLIRFLVAQGADVNALDEYGQTPLISMLRYAHPEHMEYVHELVLHLIEQGAELNVSSEHGCTPLMYAAWFGDTRIVEVLLRHGAELNARDDDGCSALFYALDSHLLQFQDKEQMVQLLLRKGVNATTHHSDRARSLLIASSQAGMLELVERCIENNENVNAQDSQGNTALMQACIGGHGAIVDLLCSHGADIGIENKYKDNAISLAERYSSDSVKEVFLRRGIVFPPAPSLADANLDASGRTPLMLACKDKRLEQVRSCLASGADVNRQDRYGKTALHYLLDTNYYESENLRSIFELLLATENVDVNIQSRTGTTPLMHVCKVWTDDRHFAKGLLAKGALVDLVDLKGKSAMDHTKDYDTELRALLLASQNDKA